MNNTYKNLLIQTKVIVNHNIQIPIIFVFTITQLIILAIFGYTPYPDSEGYIKLANDALSYHQLYPVNNKINEYAFLWNMGAINLVQLSLWLFHSVIPLLVLYSLMKGITAWFLYSITNKLFNRKIALISLLLYCIYPANYGESTSTHSELPFIFFAMLAVYLSIVRHKHMFAGIVLAIANWVRPMGIIFILSLFLFQFNNWRKNRNLLIGYLIMILIIGSINYQRTNLFLYQAKTGWMALCDYSTNHCEASLSILENNDLNVSQKDNEWKKLFIEWLKEHPKEYIYKMPIKLIRTYISDNINMCAFIVDKKNKEYMYNELSMSSLKCSFPHYSTIQWITIFNLIIYYSFIIMAILGLVYYRKDNILLPVSIIILGTLLLLFVGHGEARFHQPFMPFFIMLSGLFLNRKNAGA